MYCWCCQTCYMDTLSLVTLMGTAWNDSISQSCSSGKMHYKSLTYYCSWLFTEDTLWSSGIVAHPSSFTTQVCARRCFLAQRSTKGCLFKPCCQLRPVWTSYSDLSDKKKKKEKLFCIQKSFPPPDYSVYTSEIVVCENPKRLALFEIPEPAHLAPTTQPCSKPLRSDFPRILTLDGCCMITAVYAQV